MNNFINLKELMDWSYLTGPAPYSLSYEKIIIFMLVSFLIITLTLYFMSREKVTAVRPNRQLFKAIANFLLVLDIFGALAYFSRVQALPLFSMRLMLLLWAFLLVLGVITLVLYIIFRHIHNLKAYFKEQLRLQYIPKKRG